MNGDKEWFLGGKRHREDGPATERANGDQEWWYNGMRHREDGPAVVRNRYKGWWYHGLRHRQGGPAVEYLDPDGLVAWLLYGVACTEDDVMTETK
jgi:hypothetical protein